MSQENKFNPISKHNLSKIKSPKQKKSKPSPIDQFLNDLNVNIDESFNSDQSVISNVGSDTLSYISDFEKLTHNFNSRAQKHYRYLVKLLPIFIIFIPSLLKIFFPHVIRLGLIEIGDDVNNPSNILIDFFSILLICWIIKFLLDWPWKWYAQINEVKLKLYTMLESSLHSDPDNINNGKGKGDFERITNQNLTILRLQQFCALILCIGSPFLSGLLLFFAREYIIVIGNDETNDQSLIFSDLNIGIFVSCGIIRVVIQISEHIQQSTASIELNTEKFISEHNHINSLDIELRATRTSLINQDVQLMDKLTVLERQFVQLSRKFDSFYKANKFAIDGNSTFLTSKHFKILEKEINELRFNIETKTTDLDARLHSMVIASSSPPVAPSPSPPTSSPPPPSLPQLFVDNSSTSLHGIPLSPKGPSYHPPSNKSNSMFFSDQYINFTQQLPSPLSKLGQLIPFLNELSPATPEEDEKRDQLVMKELQQLDKTQKLKLGPRPIVEFILMTPSFFKSIAWELISYVPTSILKITYLTLLGVLDILLSKTDEDHVIKLTQDDAETIENLKLTTYNTNE